MATPTTSASTPSSSSSATVPNKKHPTGYVSHLHQVSSTSRLRPTQPSAATSSSAASTKPSTPTSSSSGPASRSFSHPPSSRSPHLTTSSSASSLHAAAKEGPQLDALVEFGGRKKRLRMGFEELQKSGPDLLSSRIRGMFEVSGRLLIEIYDTTFCEWIEMESLEDLKQPALRIRASTHSSGSSPIAAGAIVPAGPAAAASSNLKLPSTTPQEPPMIPLSSVMKTVAKPAPPTGPPSALSAAAGGRPKILLGVPTPSTTAGGGGSAYGGKKTPTTGEAPEEQNKPTTDATTDLSSAATQVVIKEPPPTSSSAPKVQFDPFAATAATVPRPGRVSDSASSRPSVIPKPASTSKLPVPPKLEPKLEPSTSSAFAKPVARRPPGPGGKQASSIGVGGTSPAVSHLTVPAGSKPRDNVKAATPSPRKPFDPFESEKAYAQFSVAAPAMAVTSSAAATVPGKRAVPIRSRSAGVSSSSNKPGSFKTKSTLLTSENAAEDTPAAALSSPSAATIPSRLSARPTPSSRAALSAAAKAAPPHALSAKDRHGSPPATLASGGPPKDPFDDRSGSPRLTPVGGELIDPNDNAAGSGTAFRKTWQKPSSRNSYHALEQDIYAAAGPGVQESPSVASVASENVAVRPSPGYGAVAKPGGPSHRPVVVSSASKTASKAPPVGLTDPVPPPALDRSSRNRNAPSSSSSALDTSACASSIVSNPMDTSAVTVSAILEEVPTPDKSRPTCPPLAFVPNPGIDFNETSSSSPPAIGEVAALNQSSSGSFVMSTPLKVQYSLTSKETPDNEYIALSPTIGPDPLTSFNHPQGSSPSHLILAGYGVTRVDTARSPSPRGVVDVSTSLSPYTGTSPSAVLTTAHPNLVSMSVVNTTLSTQGSSPPVMYGPGATSSYVMESSSVLSNNTSVPNFSRMSTSIASTSSSQGQAAIMMMTPLPGVAYVPNSSSIPQQPTQPTSTQPINGYPQSGSFSLASTGSGSSNSASSPFYYYRYSNVHGVGAGPSGAATVTNQPSMASPLSTATTPGTFYNAPIQYVNTSFPAPAPAPAPAPQPGTASIAKPQPQKRA